jgi:hypothetical protein
MRFYLSEFAYPHLITRLARPDATRYAAPVTRQSSLKIIAVEIAMIEDNRNREEFGKYEYYKILKGPSEIDRPVRVVYNHENNIIGADTINAEGQKLVKATGIISEAMNSPYSDDSTEEEFWVLCEEHAQRVKNKLSE